MFNLNELIEMHVALNELKILVSVLKKKNCLEVEQVEKIITKFNYKLSSSIQILKQQKDDLNLPYSDKIY
jgi:hypothetical protein